MALTRCSNCGNEVPDSRFCIRCGHHFEGGTPALSTLSRGLSGAFQIDPRSLSGVRRAFAAAPEEPVLRPSVVSTIFPQLPRPRMAVFRICLALGIATVLVLGLAKLYPVALVAGAVMLPLLVVLYMVDVNVFEHMSLRVIGGTLAWGVVTGIGTAFLARSLSPSGSEVFVGSHSDLVVSRGVLVPLLSVVLILAGPLALLRYPRFNTVLDGATFAAASASAFGGAEVVVQAASILGQGLRPPGSVVPWLVQLAIIAIALPLVSMATMAATAGAVWLTVRAPIRDRRALGRLGAVHVALPLAAAAFVGSGVIQLTAAPGIALAVIAALGIAGLVWLRQVIHVGLLEEALLIEDGPIIVCANCGERTRRGSFCENCGIATSALPASRSVVGSGPR